MVKINQTQELSELALGSRLRELPDGLYFLFERTDALAANTVSQELELCHSKCALDWIDYYAVFIQTGQNRPQVMLVFFGTGACDEDVVNVRIAEVQATQDLVDKALKCLSCISQPKWHLQELEQAKQSGDGGLRDVCRLDWNLMVSTDEVQFGEDGSPM